MKGGDDISGRMCARGFRNALSLSFLSPQVCHIVLAQKGQGFETRRDPCKDGDERGCTSAVSFRPQDQPFLVSPFLMAAASEQPGTGYR